MGRTASIISTIETYHIDSFWCSTLISKMDKSGERGLWGKLRDAFMEGSYGNTWEEASVEWTVYKVETAEEGQDAYCVCGHSIKYQCYVKNIVTDQELIVGTTCVQNFTSELLWREAIPFYKQAVKANKAQSQKASIDAERQKHGDELSLHDRSWGNHPIDDTPAVHIEPEVNHVAKPMVWCFGHDFKDTCIRCNQTEVLYVTRVCYQCTQAEQQAAAVALCGSNHYGHLSQLFEKSVAAMQACAQCSRRSLLNTDGVCWMCIGCISAKPKSSRTNAPAGLGQTPNYFKAIEPTQ